MSFVFVGFFVFLHTMNGAGTGIISDLTDAFADKVKAQKADNEKLRKL